MGFLNARQSSLALLLYSRTRFCLVDHLLQGQGSRSFVAFSSGLHFGTCKRREPSMADLMSIGSHCAHPDCGQIDFLPFKCDCCSRVFCLEHRSYRAHKCELASGRDTNVIVCPICAKSIRLQGVEDVNQAFDAHTRTDCDPSNYSRVHHKPRCGAPSCKQRLTEVNSYTCKQCGMKVCLAHRLESDHTCRGALHLPLIGQALHL